MGRGRGGQWCIGDRGVGRGHGSQWCRGDRGVGLDRINT